MSALLQSTSQLSVSSEGFRERQYESRTHNGEAQPLANKILTIGIIPQNEVHTPFSKEMYVLSV